MFLQPDFVPLGIHALPKAVVFVNSQVPLLRQPLLLNPKAIFLEPFPQLRHGGHGLENQRFLRDLAVSPPIGPWRALQDMDNGLPPHPGDDDHTGLSPVHSPQAVTQTKVNRRTVIDFDIYSFADTGKINIENHKLPTNYSFIPHEINLKISDNSDSNKKIPIIQGLTEQNCDILYVNFQPQTNIKGNPYRSFCEEDKLYISIDYSTESPKKKPHLNSGIIAGIVVGCIIVFAAIIVTIYVLKRKSSKLIFEVLKNTSFTIMPFVSNKLQKIK